MTTDAGLYAVSDTTLVRVDVIGSADVTVHTNISTSATDVAVNDNLFVHVRSIPGLDTDVNPLYR